MQNTRDLNDIIPDKLFLQGFDWIASTCKSTGVTCFCFVTTDFTLAGDCGGVLGTKKKAFAYNTTWFMIYILYSNSS